MNQYFLNRVSVRNFSDKPVSDSLIEQMLEGAAHAPTTGNMQLYSVIITRDKDKKAELAPAHFSQPAYMNAPVILTFCADYNRFVRWCELRKAVPGYNNFQSFIAAMLDAVIFAQQFVTIAENEGLGTCYLGTTTYNAPMIADTLCLPELVVPVITVALGWPEGESEKSDRLPVESFIHHETYRVPGEKDIDKFYEEKENREDSKKFIEENGKETLAQVFTDVRYTREASEHFSDVFIEFLRRAKFME